MLDLTAVRAKLMRSAEHSEAIKNEIRAWIDRRPYNLVTKRNPDCTRFGLVVRINEEPPLLRWSLMFADYINNLRTCLDYLVYTIASHESAPDPPAHESELMFPITDCPANFEHAVNKRMRLGTISDRVRTAIESVQPYKRKHPDLPPLLAILRDFSNADKHRLLRLVYGTPQMGSFGFAGNQPVGANIRPLPPHTGEIEDGTEVFAVVSDLPAPEMNYDRTIVDVVIAVQHGKRDPSSTDWHDRTEVAALMSELSQEVRRTIYYVSGEVA